MLGLSRATLAVEARVDFLSLGRFETGRTTSPEIIAALQAALEARGAVFRTYDGIAWVGVRTEAQTVAFSLSVE